MVLAWSGKENVGGRGLKSGRDQNFHARIVLLYPDPPLAVNPVFAPDMK